MGEKNQIHSKLFPILFLQSINGMEPGKKKISKFKHSIRVVWKCQILISKIKQSSILEQLFHEASDIGGDIFHKKKKFWKNFQVLSVLIPENVTSCSSCAFSEFSILTKIFLQKPFLIETFRKSHVVIGKFHNVLDFEKSFSAASKIEWKICLSNSWCLSGTHQINILQCFWQNIMSNYTIQQRPPSLSFCPFDH